MKRLEDPRFLTGRAHYMDDTRLDGMLHAAFVRSPHPHARIMGIDKGEALRQPGVVAVFTGADLEGKVRPMVEAASPGEAGEWGANTSGVVMKAFALEEANFVGEAVAVVIADDPYLAEAGAELVRVEYEPLPAVMDPEAALGGGSP